MEPKAVRLGLAALASPLEVGAGEAPALVERLERSWRDAGLPGLELCRAPAPLDSADAAVSAGRWFYDQRVDALCLIAACWCEDYLALDLLEECAVPLVLWSRPGMETGSLCAMQQLGMMLTALGRPFIALFDTPDAPAARQRAWEFVQAAALQRQLRRARLGILGHRVEGMTETTPHELALKKLLGPRVVGLDSQLLQARAAAIPSDSLTAETERLRARVGGTTATPQALLTALQTHAALRDTIREAGLDALAVGCYPHLMGVVCLAASLLGEAGVPIACEGDLNGALGMLILTRLAAQHVHNGDLLDPIAAQNSIVFSHCGSGAFELAEEPRRVTLAPVRLMERGVCALFTSRPGPVTLLNIVPTLDGYRLAALYGEAIPTDMVFPGNPLRVSFQTDYRDILAWIAANGLGHHWMAAYGDHRAALGHLARLTGCGWLCLA